MEFEDIMHYCESDNQNVFNKLLSRCKSGYAVPYIGAGLSMFTGLPSWTEFLNKLKEKCGDNSISLDNPLEAADEIERKLGSKKFYDFVKNVFHHDESDEWWKELIINNKISTQAVSIIPRLFQGPIITSNYDKVIEATHNFSIEVALPYEIEKLKNTNNEIKHLVYKVHGCISQPENIVFTGKSYNSYYSGKSNHVKILSRFFKRFNLLFLGCSLDLSNKDKPIELWEKLIKSEQQHYAILPCANSNFAKRRKELERINIYPIFYPEGRHECVKTILKELVKEKNDSSISIPEYDQEKYPFIGRKSVICEIKTKLDTGNGKVLTLSGLGGVGKTRLACEFAKLNKNSYTSGVYFFNSASEEVVYADIIHFVRKKQLLADSEQNPSKTVIYEKIGEWMKSNDDWLFILDNVEEFKHVKKLTELIRDIPDKGKRNFIITTRNQKKSNNSIIVDSFNKEEAKQYLLKLTKEEPNEYSNKIAELLGLLPLALEQAASYIVKERINYHEYYQLLDKKGLLEILKRGDHTDNTLTINATYNLSIEKLSCDEIKQLLYLCSYFAPDNIKIEWLQESNDFLQYYPRLSEKIINLDQLNLMVEELSSYSLIREDNGVINIHRLTQTVVRRMLDDYEWLDICSKIMDKVFDMDNFDRTDSKSLFLEMVPHMEQMFSFYEQRHPHIYTTILGHLYHIYMFGFDKIKEHDLALKYLGKTLEIRNMFDNKSEFANTLNLVGVIYQNKGNYKRAMYYFNRALKKGKEAYNTSGDKHDESLIAKIYNNVALNYYWIGKYEKSKKYHGLAIHIKEKYDDLDNLAFSYNNIGALFEAMSKRDNYVAMSYYQKAFDIRKEKDDLVNIAFTLNNMGVIEKNLGNYKDALLYLFTALKQRETVYGLDAIHPDIAQTCTNIADIYINMGNFEEARQMLKRAITIYEIKLTDKHIDTSKAYYSMAKWYYTQSLYNEALPWFYRVLDIRKAVHDASDGSELMELERMINNCEKQANGGDLL